LAFNFARVFFTSGMMHRAFFAGEALEVPGDTGHREGQ
jgi:hypothetical protein